MHEREILFFDGGMTWEEGKRLPFLTSEDVEEADKFRTERDKVAHLVSAYFKRKYVGEWRVTDRGKPVSDGVFFNVSHSGNVVVFVRADRPVGVDVEVVREIGDEVKRRVLTEEERREGGATDEAFFALWTAKESLVKADGAGMNAHPQDVPGLPVFGEKRYKGKTYYTAQTTLHGAVVAVTVEGNEPFRPTLKRETFK